MRAVALVTALSVLTGGYGVQATESTDSTTTSAATTEATDDTTASVSTTDTSETDDDEYVDERIENNYTNVSAKYTSPKYTGDSISYSLADALVSESDNVKKTSEVEGYTESSEVVEISELKEEATFKIDVAEDGVYLVRFDYLPYDMDSTLSVEGTLKVNGEVPFYEARRQTFESKWLRDDETDYDRYGNEIASTPVKSSDWLSKYVMDSSYRYSTPLAIELKAGENEISFTLTEGKVKLGNMYLEAETTVDAYTSHEVTGDELITIQAEDMDYRNDSSIRPTNEYDLALYPYETSKKVLNIVDSASFSDAGQTIGYTVEVKESGYYYLATHYRQNDKKDYPVFLDVKVDGTIPNEAFQSQAFDYNSGFENYILQYNDENAAIYLEAGTHEITFTISNDNIREALETVDVVMSEINDLSLEITKVAGSNSDKYREIEITDYIPDVTDRLDKWINQLQQVYDDLKVYSDKENPGALSSINIAIKQLQSLADEPNQIPYRKDELSSSSSSVNQYIANFITDITANDISFDRIYLTQDEDALPDEPGFFAKLWEMIKRFIASFTDQSYSVDNVEATHLQVWVNRSRQYLEIIQRMIDSGFTEETGIQVDLSIMPDANKLILANAAGEAPDVAMAVNYALPYDLAIRNALVDLTTFDDYQEVLSQFPAGLLIPSTLNGGIYSVPETFYFYVLYYRSDILEKLGLEVPNTMEEVEAMIPDLKNRGLDFFYPTAGTTGQRTLAMTTPLIFQNGGSVYNNDGIATTSINGEAEMEALTTLTDLFTIYNIAPEVTNFYQHFRNGDMPIGIGDYFVYNMLINAAPEIENSWEIALVPGIDTGEVDENGDEIINRQTAGGAESGIIFKSDDDDEPVITTDGREVDREEASWEFLKWWMSTDTQVNFGTTLQTTYGKEFIWNSANKEALAQLPWKSEAKEVILQQMDYIEESPRIPGTYMLEREISNAYIAVVNSGDNLRTSIDAAVKNINRETQRKLEEFGYIDEDGNVITPYEVPTVDTVKKILGQE
jgi:ABC-type glycerol-3-phosphate transport system substrate-binding protein